MSNLGMRIKGDVFEVGFEAETREEFDSFIAKLQMVAESIWPIEEAPKNYQKEYDRQLAEQHGAYASERKTATEWREDQGLR